MTTAVANFLGRPTDELQYAQAAVASFTELDRHRVILERWKRRAERLLIGVVASIKPEGEELDDIAARLPETFKVENWHFSPGDLLAAERDRLESAVSDQSSSTDEAFRLMPGKALISGAAKATGMTPQAYTSFVIHAIADDGDGRAQLRSEICAGLARYIPISAKTT